jgi:uncharacterized membrane protein HdeD (DUF308 family)
MTLAADDRFIAIVARNWWALALRGILALLLAVVAFLLPGLTLASLILLLAAYFIIDGVLALISGWRTARRDGRWWPFLLEGVLDLIAGAIALVWPAATLLALVVLLAAWSILTGAVMLYGAFGGYRGEGRWLLALNGAISVLLGVAIIVFPEAGALTIAWLVGLYALLFGAGMLALAFRLRKLQEGAAGPALRI